MEGLEPTRLAALDPKSSASANSATSAKVSKCNVIILLLVNKIDIMFLNQFIITI